MSFLSCKWSAADIADLGCFRPAVPPTASGPRSARQLLERCAVPVSDCAFRDSARNSDLSEETLPCPVFMRSVCALRDVFQFSVLKAVSGEECVYFLLVLMVQRPSEIVMMRLLELNVEESELSCASVALRAADMCPPALKFFTYDAGFYTESSVWESLESCDLSIYSNTLFCGSGVVAVFSDCESLSGILEAHLREGRGAKSSRPVSHAVGGSASSTVGDTTWVLGAFSRAHTERRVEASAVVEDVHLAEEVEDSVEEREMADDIFAELSVEIAGRREEMRSTIANNMTELFTWQILGGAWQRERTGRDLYGVRVNVKAATDLYTFASRFRLGLSASFEYNIYTEIHSEAFARIWAERLLVLFEDYVNGGERLDWTGASCARSELPAELTDVLATLGKRAQTRVSKILDLRP
eukprot:4244580-Amphidinium_carterae.1